MIVGVTVAVLVLCGLFVTNQKHVPNPGMARRMGGMFLVIGVLVVALISTGTSVGEAMVPTVVLGTSSDHAVLAGSTVTNTGATVVDGSLGLWPGT
jgi:hypothetical protein